MTPDERAEKLETARAEVARLERVDDGSLDTEVTALIPVGPWGLDYLWTVLRSLELGAQSVPIRVTLAVAEKARAELAALEAAVEWRKRFARFSLLPTIRDAGAKWPNILAAREALAQSAGTPFALFVDHDVRVPAGAVAAMLAELKADSALGAVGVPYSPSCDHVQLGCTMFRTELLQRMRWVVDGCDCRAAMQDVVDAGYEVRRLEGYAACHLRLQRMS